MNRRSFLKLLAAVPIIGLAVKTKATEPVEYNLPGGRSRWYDILWGKPKSEPPETACPILPGTTCPVCGSPDVDIDNGQLICYNCGAKGEFRVMLKTNYSQLYAEQIVEKPKVIFSMTKRNMPVNLWKDRRQNFI